MTSADRVHALLIRYIEESKLDDEVSEQILTRILKILFPDKPNRESVKQQEF